MLKYLYFNVLVCYNLIRAQFICYIKGICKNDQWSFELNCCYAMLLIQTTYLVINLTTVIIFVIFVTWKIIIWNGIKLCHQLAHRSYWHLPNDFWHLNTFFKTYYFYIYTYTTHNWFTFMIKWHWLQNWLIMIKIF